MQRADNKVTDVRQKVQELEHLERLLWRQCWRVDRIRAAKCDNTLHFDESAQGKYSVRALRVLMGILTESDSATEQGRTARKDVRKHRRRQS